MAPKSHFNVAATTLVLRELTMGELTLP